MNGIEKELQTQLKKFKDNDQLLEAQRLRMRTEHDLEMMDEVDSVLESKTIPCTLTAGIRETLRIHS